MESSAGSVCRPLAASPMRALLLLLLLLAPQAVAAGDGWVSISDLDFSKCKPGDAHQSFSIESMDSVGTIKDEATSRCLAVKECTGTDGPTDLNKCSSTCELTGTHKVVVLDACSSSSDGCGGKSQQWTTKKDATGVLQFNSALNKAGGAEMCLTPPAIRPRWRASAFSSGRAARPAPRTRTSGSITTLILAPSPPRHRASLRMAAPAWAAA